MLYIELLIMICLRIISVQYKTSLENLLAPAPLLCENVNILLATWRLETTAVCKYNPCHAQKRQLL